MARRKWKGKITKDLTNGYRSTIKKGTEVVCWKKRRYEIDIITNKLEWTGEMEYHYTDEVNRILVRTREFLIEGESDE